MLSIFAFNIRKVGARHLIFVAELSLVVLLGWIVSQAVWTFLTPMPGSSATSIGLTASTTRQIEQLRPESFMFDPFRNGERAMGVDGRLPVGQDGDDLPETSLRIVLAGVRSGSSGGGSAVIKLPTGGQQIFREGDEIMAGVRLRSVQPGRIVLEHRGRLEALNFFEDGGQFSMLAPAASEPSTDPDVAQRSSDVAGSPTGMPQDLLQTTRTFFLQGGAQSFARAVRLNSRADGSGYSLSPGTDRAAFDRLGLMPGDLLTHVQGVADLSDLQQVMAELDDQSRLDLVIERRGNVLHHVYRLAE